MMLIAQGGASAGKVRAIWPIQSSRTSSVRALLPGNAPMMPALQAASTMSTPDTRNIGAAIAGSLRRSAIWAGRPTVSPPGSTGWAASAARG